MARRLQSRGTKSARRLLRKRSGKERRFAADVNHGIARELDGGEWHAHAERSGRGIAIEAWTGIRERVRVRKAGRRQHSSWALTICGRRSQTRRVFGCPCDSGGSPQYIANMSRVRALGEGESAVTGAVCMSVLRPRLACGRQRCLQHGG
jgi:hypothetical protein